MPFVGLSGFFVVAIIFNFVYRGFQVFAKTVAKAFRFFSHFSLLKLHVSEQALCLDGSHGGP